MSKCSAVADRFLEVRPMTGFFEPDHLLPARSIERIEIFFDYFCRHHHVVSAGEEENRHIDFRDLFKEIYVVERFPPEMRERERG